MKLVVLIPAFNEEANLGKVIKTIPRRIKGIKKVEVLVVDDGSTDKTVQVAKKAGANRVVSLGKNKGIGAAFKAGIKNALEMNTDIMVKIDGDGQFDSNDVAKIIQPILKN